MRPTKRKASHRQDTRPKKSLRNQKSERPSRSTRANRKRVSFRKGSDSGEEEDESIESEEEHEKVPKRTSHNTRAVQGERSESAKEEEKEEEPKRRTRSRRYVQHEKEEKSKLKEKEEEGGNARQLRSRTNKVVYALDEYAEAEEEEEVEKQNNEELDTAEEEEVEEQQDSEEVEEVESEQSSQEEEEDQPEQSNEEEEAEQPEEPSEEEEEEEEEPFEPEQIVVVKIKAKPAKKPTAAPVKKSTPPVQKSTPPVQPVPEAAPLSAIAARKAAMDAGLYKEPEADEDMDAEMTEEEEEEEEQEHDGISVRSISDDEEEMELREAMEIEDDEVVPISGANTPNGASTPRPTTPSTKKYKIPPLMDQLSVSKFTPSDSNQCTIRQEDDVYLFIGLKEREEIVFMGQVLVAPLFGSISIAGAVISSGRSIPPEKPEMPFLVSLYPVFSPRTHSLLRIVSEPLDEPSIQIHYEPIEMDENLVGAVFDDLKDSWDEFETIVVIKELKSGLDEMRNVVSSFPKNLFKFSKKEVVMSKDNFFKHVDGFCPILEMTPGVNAFKEETSWEQRTQLALDRATALQRPLVGVVCGAKDMGKSTYCRYLINRLLSKYNKVAYLETDVGQSEFTPSGLLSLHYLTKPVLGPPYTHQQLASERSFFFGSTSSRNNPDYYIECIFELVDHCKQDQAKVQDESNEREWIPLVVNTQGWVSGVGYDLLIDQIQKIGPTDIFTMRHPYHEYKNLPHTFNMDIVPKQSTVFMAEKEAATLHYLDCVLLDPEMMTIKDSFTSNQLRDMTLGSYFHQSKMGYGLDYDMNDEHYLLPEWNYQQHLIYKQPWVVDWRQQLNAVWIIHEEVKLNELFYALNGSLVGLIGDVDEFKKQDGPATSKKPLELNNDTFTLPKYYNTQDQPKPKANKTTCYGLGIIRAIDPSRHAFLLLTPVPQVTLSHVSGIIKGEMQLPLWTMLDHKLEKNTHGVTHVPWKKVPYITQERTEGAGANALRVRRNLLRRS